MHNGLKFRDDAGDTKAVSADNPLPVTIAAGGGGGVTMADLLAELQTQTALLVEIRDNTAA